MRNIRKNYYQYILYFKKFSSKKNFIENIKKIFLFKKKLLIKFK